MSSAQPQDPKLPRFTVREAQMAEFLADAGNMLDALQSAEQRLRDQRVLLDLAADKLKQHCDRIDETTERCTKAINSVEKSSRERYTTAIVEMTRRALEQALAEVRAAGETERTSLLQTGARHTGAAARPKATVATSVNHWPDRSPATQVPPVAQHIQPLQPPTAPLWLRYPRVNLVITAASLSVAYYLVR